MSTLCLAAGARSAACRRPGAQGREEEAGKAQAQRALGGFWLRKLDAKCNSC